MSARALFFSLALFFALAAPARAGGPIGEPEPEAKAGDETKKGFELYRKRDYKNARIEFEKALKKGADNDTVRGYLARIAYFYAEDELAREHLSKIESKNPWDERLEAIIETPFRKDYKDALVLMQGVSERRHYFLATDLGFDQKKWDSVKAQYAQLQAALEKKRGKGAEKALEQFLSENRSPGWKACQKSLDDIYEQYESIFPKEKFPKDPKLIARVFIFKERADYLDFAKFLGHEDPESTGGIYFPTFRLLIVSSRDVGRQYDGGLWQGTREVMFHEAFHQFLDYFIEDAPSWLNEGLAEFFATADEDGKTKKLAIGKVQKEPIGSMGLTNYQQIIGALKPTARFPPLPIKEFVRLTQDRYYAKEIPLRSEREAKMAANYAQGWAVCYFLIMGLPKGRGILVEYIKALKAGKDNETAIAEAFKDYKTDGDWEKLDKQFREFLLKL